MFPPEALIPILALLKACVWGVTCPLGDRVRQAPGLWNPPYKLIPEKLAVRIQRWLQKRRLMIEALVQRIAAGTHRPRPYKAREPRPDAAAKPRAPTPSDERLPRKLGWINAMAQEVNVHAHRLSHVIGLPEMKAMILASPHLARLWVPLLNACGQTRPDWWPKPPPRPRRPRPPRPRFRKPVVAGLDPVIPPAPADPPPGPAQPPAPTYPNPLAGIRNWVEYVDYMRPVSQNFEPPPVDDPVPLQLKPLWRGVVLTSKGSRWEI